MDTTTASLPEKVSCQVSHKHHNASAYADWRRIRSQMYARGNGVQSAFQPSNINTQSGVKS